MISFNLLSLGVTRLSRVVSLLFLRCVFVVFGDLWLLKFL